MNQNDKKSIIAGLYGNALEWYDFLLYASFAPIFAKIFFPTHVQFISLIATFTVFAVGFLMRPIGGVLLGHYADYAGRRKVLILSVSIMTTATLAIGFLPSFGSIGIFAPLLFTFFRLLQGLAVGGELPSSATFLIEHMFTHRRGFAGSLILSTAFFGIFSGSLVAFILSDIFSPEQLSSWAWRVAYIFGGFLGIIGIYMRVKSIESPKFLEMQPAKELPAKLIFTQYGKELLLGIILTSITALANYILIAYTTTFLVNTEGFLLRDVLVINFIALLLLTIFIPFMGFLSDYKGRKPVFLFGLISLLILNFPIFALLASGSWSNALLAEVLLAAILAPINATLATILVEMFPTEVRASGTSIGYNIAQAIFGGTVPLVALTLIEITGNKFAPAWYVFICASCVLIATKFLPETYKNH